MYRNPKFKGRETGQKVKALEGINYIEGVGARNIQA